MIPAKRPGLLGTDTGHQHKTRWALEPGTPGGLQYSGGLLGGQGLARPSGLTLRGVDQRRHVVYNVTVGLGVAQGAGQRVVRDHDRPAGADGASCTRARSTSWAVSIRNSMPPMMAVSGLSMS